MKVKNATMIRRGWKLALLAMTTYLQLFSVAGQCLNAPVLKGKKFFDSVTGQYIPIKGINYYPRPNAGELGTGGSRDYFTAEFDYIWKRDIAEFKALGVNVIRLYAVDPGADHDDFMCALQNAGIYVIVGLAATCEDCSILEDPAPTCYPGALKERGQYIINVFSKYTNVIAFSAGNEVNLVAPENMPEVNAACQKQFLRDMRAFIASCSTVMRQIPVGLVLADIDRDENTLYYGCKTDPTDDLEVTEWYGLNTYVHCNGRATSIDELTGYQNLLADFKGYNLPYPVVLTEFGCLNPSFPTIDGYEAQRTWLQVDAIFSAEYSQEFAGGVVFEYNTEKVYSETDSPHPFDTYGPGNYGVGYFSPENCDDMPTGTFCEYIRFPQFETLSGKYGAVDTSAEPSMANYNPGAGSDPDCPAGFPILGDFTWAADSVEDLVCWGDGGFTCPSCGGAPPATTTAPPTAMPTASPTETAQEEPTGAPTVVPTGAPQEEPTVAPQDEPTAMPQDEQPTQTPQGQEEPTQSPSQTTPVPQTPEPSQGAATTPAPSKGTTTEGPETEAPTTEAPIPKPTFNFATSPEPTMSSASGLSVFPAAFTGLFCAILGFFYG